MIKPRSKGGLGLGSLENKNWALLVKWWWRFGDERDALGRRVIATKFGEDKWGWWPVPGPKYRRSGLWAAIVSVGDASSEWGKVLSRGMGFVVGDGRDVRFWLDD